MRNNDSFKGENNQRAPDLYPANNITSNEGDKMAEVNEEKEDKQLLGKKRKSTSLQKNASSQNKLKKEDIVLPEAHGQTKNESNSEGPNHQNGLCPEINSEQLRQSNIHSLLENLENLENLLMRVGILLNLEIMNEFLEELEVMAFCEASTEASSDSGEKEEDGPNNEDQN